MRLLFRLLRRLTLLEAIVLVLVVGAPSVIAYYVGNATGRAVVVNEAAPEINEVNRRIGNLNHRLATALARNESDCRMITQHNPKMSSVLIATDKLCAAPAVLPARQRMDCFWARASRAVYVGYFLDSGAPDR